LSSGYRHASYAQALAEFGRPRLLPASGGWVLLRPIPDSTRLDAQSCYPLLACADWTQLALDVDELARERNLVSLTAVTDPLGGCSVAELRRAFPALARPFKEHFIVDLQLPWRDLVSAHHRRNARQALNAVEVEQVAPETVLAEWQQLYAHLIERHAIQGLTAFSPASFAGQLQVPGLTVWRARQQGETVGQPGETVGMMLWYRCEDRAYYHLAAYAPRGYELKASFALCWRAFEQFAETGVRWLALGAGAGLGEQADDGLTRFKRGWATGTRTAYLCGRIFDQTAYDELCAMTGATGEAFFPAYRSPRRALAQRSQTV
jgi:hypothetical protein